MKLRFQDWDRLPLEIKQRIILAFLNIAISDERPLKCRTIAPLLFVSYAFGHQECEIPIKQTLARLAVKQESADEDNAKARKLYRALGTNLALLVKIQETRAVLGLAPNCC